MKLYTNFSALFYLLLCALSLTACGSRLDLFSHIAKEVPMEGDGTYGQQGLFKIGRPYQVEGKWYTPQETYSYTETGIASWYGPGFHGRRTANGEVFDPNELTAAHRTLQLPSLVRVTNLENGRSLVVRVNDRGPFRRGRVMDVSKKAAQLLGFIGNGTARVRLDLLADESRQIADAARQGRDTSGVEVALNESRPLRMEQISYQPQLTQSDIAAPMVPGHVENGKFLPDPVVRQFPVTPTSLYVQAGSFSSRENAAHLARSLSQFGNAQVYQVDVQGAPFYRVRVGPLPSVDQADNLLSRLVANGQKQAIIVVN